MAFTVTDVLVSANLEGTDKALRILNLNFDASYAAGGEAFTPADVQLSTIDFVAITAVPGAKTGRWVEFNPTGNLLVVKQSDNPNVAAAPGVEVPNLTDLSGLNIRVLAIGTKEA